MLSRRIKGSESEFGFTLTCTKTYKLSLALISTLSISDVAVPSTFILNGEERQPESLTCDSRSFWSLLLNILKDWVTEPTVVKTVSKDKVSALVYKLALELVIKESFLHEKKMKVDNKIKMRKRFPCHPLKRI